MTPIEVRFGRHKERRCETIRYDLFPKASLFAIALATTSYLLALGSAPYSPSRLKWDCLDVGHKPRMQSVIERVLGSQGLSACQWVRRDFINLLQPDRTNLLAAILRQVTAIEIQRHPCVECIASAIVA